MRGAADKIGREDFEDKDILSLLVRANMASDLPESSRMTDEEVLAQIPTFLFAGASTTTNCRSCIYRIHLQDMRRHRLQ